MNASTFLLKLKRLTKRASSLLLLFQRTPAAQILLPAEFNLATSATFFSPAQFAIATVAGLGAYDSVAGATTLSQVAPSAGSTTVPVTSGVSLNGLFQVTGSPSQPKSWQVSSGTLPAGLTLTKSTGATATLTGTTTEVGNKTVTIKAWEKAGFSGGQVSKVFTISVAPNPSITTHPASTSINSGGSTMLTVFATGVPPPTYQWYEGASGTTTNPVGTDSPSFLTPTLNATTSYWVKVTNSVNTTGANSNTATVTVRQPAEITTHPASSSITGGQTVSMSVVATGDAPLTYQWYQGTSGVTTTPVGTNSSSFTTPALAVTTSYWVKVTNIANTSGALSSTATVTVQEPLAPTIFTSSPLATIRTGFTYNTTLVAIGGTTPYTWTVSDGALPDGLNLSTDGVISGTPTGAGTSTFTVQVADNENDISTKAFSLTVNDLAIGTTTLPTAVKGVAFNHSLIGSGGESSPSWTVSAGALPAGITLSTAGVLSGIPTAPGNAAFTVRLADNSGFAVTRSLLLPVSATFITPVIHPISFPTVTIGTDFNYTVTAENYPKTFAITGLPKGLKAVPATGTITGKPDVSGVFNVQVRATNAGGASEMVTTRLIVKALEKNLVGTFGGLVARHSSVNANRGGTLTVTTTSIGGYSIKLIGASGGGAASASYTATGRLAASAPQISVLIGGQTLALTFNPSNGEMTGTHGAATVNGWRSAWNAVAHPADHLAGYYSMALDLADVGDKGVDSIPQGSGFATFAVSLGGSLTLVGKTADGEAITSSSFLAANGDFWAYTPLYKNQGTILGTLNLSEDTAGLFVDNTITGSMTWLKPDTTSRAYAASFGTINLKVEGGYLAPSSAGNVVLGLPDAGSVQLRFTEGGLGASAINPNMSFTFTGDNKIVLPTAAVDNPGKVAVAINATNGVVGGSFTLIETTPPLTRAKVPFQGQVVRMIDGSVKAVGYFLLPQIPGVGQTAATAPMLSGGFSIESPALRTANVIPTATIGAAFNYTVVASNTPKTFAITGLPKGLKAVPATGVISGIPLVSGVYNVQVRATNAAGAVELMTIRLIVKALPSNHVGTFGGLIARDAVNHGLGGTLTVTTTSTGGYTIKLVGTSAGGAAAASYASTGFMAASAPQISTSIGGHTLALTLNETTGEMNGTHGTAAVSGWRAAWNALANPADKLAGYYSMAVDLADIGDDGVASIPQGTGFATFSVSLGGSLTLVGKTADGETITSASFLAANGDFWAHTALYKNLGSIQGPLNLSEDSAGLFADNTISGSMTWFKPTTASRAYKDTFGPINLKAEGGYLAPASKGSVVLGLPDAGDVQLSFTDGGLAASATDPDISFTYTSDNKVVLPQPVANPAKVAITINANTGAVSGNFTLTETAPSLTRAKVPFQGQVVKLVDGQVKAVGYFLLPQIPSGGQPAAAAPLLSGGIWLQQSAP
jgi:hypothetical protein